MIGSGVPAACVTVPEFCVVMERLRKPCVPSQTMLLIPGRHHVEHANDLVRREQPVGIRRLADLVDALRAGAHACRGLLHDQCIAVRGGVKDVKGDDVTTACPAVRSSRSGGARFPSGPRSIQRADQTRRRTGAHARRRPLMMCASRNFAPHRTRRLATRRRPVRFCSQD
jgi:hypothetical protein